MIANELRIGNLVIYGGSVVKMNLHEFTHFLRFPETYTPIILTEEILLKCGFVPCSIIDNHYYLEGLLLWNIQGMFINGRTDVRLKHLHQLQNLYYCLVGKELEIEL